MITEYGNFHCGNLPKDFIGKSTDVKPLGVPNASVFLEMDTGTLFLFDAETDKWLKQ